MLKKIISGGQTGADQGGLEAGILLGIGTGGTAPKSWRTESGPNPELCIAYGLSESPCSDYPPRTYANVRDSDGTVIFGNSDSPGSRLTSTYCAGLGKACLLLVDLERLDEFKVDFLEWLKAHSIQVLNVAGNRESKNPGIQKKVRDFLVEALRSKDA